MRRRRRLPEEPVNHERWLVSYADFITLLFGFFVVMYSISQVNESKYRVLSNTLTSAFNRPQVTLDPFQVGEEPRSNPLNVIEMLGSSGQPEPGGEGSRQGMQPEAFAAVSRRIENALGDLIKQELVRVEGNETWLKIELSSSLLFDSGEAQLSVPAMELLGEIVGAVGDRGHAMRVEGFTDDVPISSARFPSNWELSAARAAAVVRLFAEEGMDPAKLSAVGYGEHRPVAANDTAAGRARNRRVVLKISPAPPQPASAPESGSQAAGELSVPGVNLPEQSSRRQAERMLQQLDESPEATTEALREVEVDGVRTVELDDGGLLFTSDEEQPAP